MVSVSMSMMYCTIATGILLLMCNVSLLQAAETPRSSKEDQLFLMCDLNKDGQISEKELRICAKFPKSKGDMAKEVFRVFDKNRDDSLSPDEYFEFVSMIFDDSTTPGTGTIDEDEDEEDEEDVDEEVEVVDRDGNKKVMKKSHFDRLNREKMKGLSMEDGEMTKMEEGHTTAAEAKENNPALARVLAVGEWIQEQLKEGGHASGKMVNMKTLDSRESGVEGQKRLNDQQDFEVSHSLTTSLVQ